MRQQEYETIVACIQFGAPALSTPLITSLNKAIENSNNWTQEQKRVADEAHKAEIAKAEDEKRKAANIVADAPKTK